MDAINPIIFYLQKCMANRTISTHTLMLPYVIDACLIHMVSVLKTIQALIDHPTVMLLPDIKSANVLFQ